MVLDWCLPAANLSTTPYYHQHCSGKLLPISLLRVYGVNGWTPYHSRTLNTLCTISQASLSQMVTDMCRVLALTVRRHVYVHRSCVKSFRMSLDMLPNTFLYKHAMIKQLTCSVAEALGLRLGVSVML